MTASALQHRRTATIGHEAQTAAVAARVRAPSVRLVTLTGPGGVARRDSRWRRRRRRGASRGSCTVRVARGPDAGRGRPDGDRQRARRRDAHGRVDRPDHRAIPGVQTSADRRRQLRARAGRRAVRRRTARSVSGSAGARHQLRGDRHPSRGTLPGAGARRGHAPRAEAGDDAVPYSSSVRAPRIPGPSSRPRRRRRRRDLPAPRRPAAGDRARRGALGLLPRRRSQRASTPRSASRA